MIKRILVPTDFSDASRAALARAEELARLTDAELVVVHVRDEFPFVANDGTGFVPLQLEAQHAAERKLVLALAAEFSERGLRARGMMVLGAAAQQVLTIAEQQDADLIVMGTHGRSGLGHLVLGSVAERVLRDSPVPVMVVSLTHTQAARTADAPRNILFATDLEASSVAAVPYAFELARTLGARVHLLHAYNAIVMPGEYGLGSVPYDLLHEQAIAGVRELASPYADSALLGTCIATMGEPSLTIRETALKLDADLIVMGTHGRTGLKRFFLGSVAANVIRESACAVLVVRQVEQAAAPIERASSPEATSATAS